MTVPFCLVHSWFLFYCCRIVFVSLYNWLLVCYKHKSRPSLAVPYFVKWTIEKRAEKTRRTLNLTPAPQRVRFLYRKYHKFVYHWDVKIRIFYMVWASMLIEKGELLKKNQICILSCVARFLSLQFDLNYVCLEIN